jgi:hypothetical protein
MRKAFRSFVATSVLSVGLGLACHAIAQDASNDANRTPVVVAPGPERAPGAVREDNRGFNPGWLGLAGLAGLLGMMPKDRITGVKVTHPTEPVHPKR